MFETLPDVLTLFVMLSTSAAGSGSNVTPLVDV